MAANRFNISNSPSLIHVFQFLRALPRFMFLSLLKEMTILIFFFFIQETQTNGFTCTDWNSLWASFFESTPILPDYSICSSFTTSRLSIHLSSYNESSCNDQISSSDPDAFSTNPLPLEDHYSTNNQNTLEPWNMTPRARPLLRWGNWEPQIHRVDIISPCIRCILLMAEY